MNILETIQNIQATGTPEGVRKAWDTRGRGRRNREVSKEQWNQIWKKQAAPTRVDVQFPAQPKRGVPVRELPAAQKMFREWVKRQQEGTKEMQQWKQGHTAKSVDGTTIKDRDIVKINREESLYNKKTGDNDKFPPGKLKALVVEVLPKVGDNPQLLKVNIQVPARDTKHEEDQTRYMPVSDVSLHKAFVDNIEVQPVPKSQIKLQYTSSDGATVTFVKSQDVKEYSQRTIEEMASTPSRYKGQFNLIEKVDGAEHQTTRLYDSSPVQGSRWNVEGPATAAYKPGASVWIHRYQDRVTIQEQPYQRMGMKGRGIITWNYNNVGKAFGMMKQRYGISIPLREERF